MEDIFINKSVDFLELTEPNIDAQFDNGIRVYGGHGCGVLQLRGLSSIRRGGKKRRMIATASYLSKDDVRALIARLQEMESTLV